jgi:hypothetical protein
MHLTPFHKTLRSGVHLLTSSEKFIAPPDARSLTGHFFTFSCELSGYSLHVYRHLTRVCFASSSCSTDLSPAAGRPVLSIVSHKHQYAKCGPTWTPEMRIRSKRLWQETKDHLVKLQCVDSQTHDC